MLTNCFNVIELFIYVIPLCMHCDSDVEKIQFTKFYIVIEIHQQVSIKKMMLIGVIGR